MKFYIPVEVHAFLIMEEEDRDELYKKVSDLKAEDLDINKEKLIFKEIDNYF